MRAAAVEPVKKSAAPAAQAQKKPKKLSYKEQKELEGMEDAIMLAEEKVAELENIFSSPDFFSRYGSRSSELQSELESARQEVSRLYARWEELSALQ